MAEAAAKTEVEESKTPEVPATAEKPSSEWDDFVDFVKEEEDDTIGLVPDEGEVKETPKEEPPKAEEPEVEEVGEEAEPEPEAPKAKEEKPKEAEPATPTAAEILEQIRQSQENFYQHVQATQQPAEDPRTQWEKMRQEQRNAALAELQKQYVLSEEDADNFLSSPGEVLPRLLASAHMNALDSIVGIIQAQAPALVSSIVEQRTSTRSNAEKFFAQWPKLQDRAEDVLRIAQVWKQQNPQADQDRFVEEVGKLSHVLLNIPVDDSPPPEKTPAPAPRDTSPPPPAAPGVRAPRAVPQNLSAEEQFYAEVMNELLE